MLILVISPPNKQKSTEGFTLLELVVVLALLALVAGVVMPNAAKIVDRFQASAERDEVFEQIADLGLQARRSAKGFYLDQYPSSDESVPLQLPDGWFLQATDPIRYRANGFCEGGTLTLTASALLVTLDLQPPYCQPVL